MDDEPFQALSIGSIIGGSNARNRAWHDGIRDLTRRVKAAAQGIDSPLGVNVVFHVPGHILSPDYSGVRTGRFSRRRRLLMVQVALPVDVPEDPFRYLCDATIAAVDEAENWAERRNVESDVALLRRIVSAACDQG